MKRHHFPGFHLRLSTCMQMLSHWFKMNSLAPAWLPPRLQRPMIGYFWAVLLVLLAVVLELWMVSLFPTAEVPSGLVVFLLVVFIGANWGAGPCILATLIGTNLLYYLIYPPRFAITWKDLMDIFQGSLVLFGGLLMSLAASQRESQRRAAEERAREAEAAQRQAEAVAVSLAEAQETSERERHRLRAVLETLLAMVAALVQPEAALAAEEEQRAEDLVSQRLAELISYALSCQRVCLFALEPNKKDLTLLAAVDHSPEPTPKEQAVADEDVAVGAWLDARVLLRLHAGEMVQVELPPPVTQQRPTPAERAHLLAVPIQRGTTLLGLMLLDSPWASGHVPGEQLALIQAIAKLGALLIEREHLLHEREAARAEVLSLSAAKRNLEHFLGIASHELRTPLTSMLLGLELGRRSLDREIAQQQDHATGASKSPLEVTQQRLGLVFAQSKRLEFLVEELLENSLIEANQFCLHQKACDLVALTCQAVEEQRSLAPDRVIALHLSAEQPIPIFADAERMRQVLNSYLTNALKFSAEACPVDVGIAMDGQQAQVWVQDAGPGIHKDAHALVWERFSRVPGVEVLSGSGVGLGLGLYISRAIIERHQGQVGLQSAPGRGARFWFRVPLLSSPT